MPTLPITRILSSLFDLDVKPITEAAPIKGNGVLSQYIEDFVGGRLPLAILAIEDNCL